MQAIFSSRSAGVSSAGIITNNIEVTNQIGFLRINIGIILRSFPSVAEDNITRHRRKPPCSGFAGAPPKFCLDLGINSSLYNHESEGEQFEE
jgi:hypothetical protein